MSYMHVSEMQECIALCDINNIILMWLQLNISCDAKKARLRISYQHHAENKSKSHIPKLSGY